MEKMFLILLLSATATGVLAIPFINLLYRLKFQRQREYIGVSEPTSQVQKMHDWKVGTPSSGGILIILVAIVLGVVVYQFTSFKLNWTIGILAITLLLYGLLGLYDDSRKFLERPKSGVWGISARAKLVVQLAFGLVIGWLLHSQMGLQEIRLPWGYVLDLGLLFIPFACLAITTTSNAFNITDGLDGLSTGLLLIALAAFWYLAVTFSTPDVVLFIAVLMGSLLAFLYFNIYPARIYMGDAGALAFGAALAVIALMSGNAFALPLIGGVFFAELASSAIQIASKRFRGGRKVFRVAPLHHHFESLGWTETKVTMRFWLAGAVCAFIGLWIASL